MWAVRNGAPSILRALAERENGDILPVLIKYVRCAESLNLKPMEEACKSGDADVVDLLLKADPASAFTTCCLIEAISHKRGHIVDLLLNNISSRQDYLRAQANRGKSLLVTAAGLSYPQVVEALVVLHRSFDVFTVVEIKDAVLLAASLGDASTIDCLLSCRVQWQDYQDVLGFQEALMIAAKQNHEGVARIVLGLAGALIPKRHLDNALIEASKSGHSRLVSFLIEQGANVRAKDDVGREPLYFAIAKARELVVNVLLKKGARLGPSCLLESEVLPHIVEAGKVNLLDAVLTAHTGVVNMQDLSKLLYIAAKGDHSDAVSFLLNFVPDLELASRKVSGSHAIHVAAANGCDSVISALLGRGVPVSIM